ncbi:MAG: hypothetical protein HY909_25835 [Deltaproteobacteria bacterium]|nr:hypothetical protein [Deltaproteobacteria bacterium]
MSGERVGHTRTTPSGSPSPAARRSAPAGSEAEALPPLPEASPGASSPARVQAFADAVAAHFSARLAGVSPQGMLRAAATAILDASQEVQESNLESQRQAREAASAAQEQSLREAADAEGNKSFWDKIGTVAKYIGLGAAIAGSALALACTGGASTLTLIASITALVSATSSLAVDIVHACGVHIPGELGLVLVGVSIASALLSGGASLFGTAGSLSRTGAVLSQVTNLVSGGSQLTQGTAGIGSAVSQHQGTLAQADAADASRARDHATHLIEQVLVSLQDAMEDRHALQGRAARLDQAEHRSRMITLRA